MSFEAEHRHGQEKVHFVRGVEIDLGRAWRHGTHRVP